MIKVKKPTKKQLAANAKKMRAAAMEGWPQGVDGIPDGWTVENL